MIRTRYYHRLIISVVFILLSVVAIAWANQPESEKITEPQWMAAEFAVTGMSCGGCVYTIQKSLKPLDGIRDVTVDLREKKVSAIYEPGKLNDPGLIAKAITDSGYPATFVAETPLKGNITKETPSQSEENQRGSCGAGGGCTCN